MNKGKIYVLKDPITDEIRYVGQTSQSLTLRLYQHWRDRNQNKEKNQYKSNWINKLYNSFKLKPIIELIEECDIELLNEREKYWIEYFFNKSFKLTNTSGKMYYRVLRTKVKSNLKAIYCYTSDYNLTIYESAREVERVLGISYKIVSNGAISKKSKNGFCFSFIELSKNEIDLAFKKLNNFGIKIIAKNLDTKKEIIFNSQQEAATFFNVNFRNINQVLTGNRFSCGNHIFKYENSNYLRETKKYKTNDKNKN